MPNFLRVVCLFFVDLIDISIHMFWRTVSETWRFLECSLFSSRGSIWWRNSISRVCNNLIPGAWLERGFAAHVPFGHALGPAAVLLPGAKPTCRPITVGHYLACMVHLTVMIRFHLHLALWAPFFHNSLLSDCEYCGSKAVTSKSNNLIRFSQRLREPALAPEREEHAKLAKCCASSHKFRMATNKRCKGGIMWMQSSVPRAFVL